MKFPDLLDQLGIKYIREGNEHCRPGWIQLNCPFCNDGQKWHLGYRLDGGYLSCWKCGFHRPLEVLAELTGKPIRECKGLLGGLEREHFRPLKPKGKLILPKGIGPLLKPHRMYLRDRKFNVKKLEELWNLQGIGVAGRLAWRIFIPVHHQGEVVSWTTRSLQKDGLRYIAASAEEEAIPHKSLLYGEDYCQHAVIVHEGPADVWATGPGAVATCGTGFSRSQIRRLARYPVRAVCFDNEPRAQELAQELCDLLEVFPGKTYNVQLDAKDAGSASPREIRRLRRAFLD